MANKAELHALVIKYLDSLSVGLYWVGNFVPMSYGVWSLRDSGMSIDRGVNEVEYNMGFKAPGAVRWVLIKVKWGFDTPSTDVGAFMRFGFNCQCLRMLLGEPMSL